MFNIKGDYFNCFHIFCLVLIHSLNLPISFWSFCFLPTTHCHPASWKKILTFLLQTIVLNSSCIKIKTENKWRVWGHCACIFCFCFVMVANSVCAKEMEYVEVNVINIKIRMLCSVQENVHSIKVAAWNILSIVTVGMK